MLSSLNIVIGLFILKQKLEAPSVSIFLYLDIIYTSNEKPFVLSSVIMHGMNSN